jgi:hypothetical protein
MPRIKMAERMIQKKTRTKIIVKRTMFSIQIQKINLLEGKQIITLTLLVKALRRRQSELKKMELKRAWWHVRQYQVPRLRVVLGLLVQMFQKVSLMKAQ